MDEKNEIRIKKRICKFIRNNFVLEGSVEMIDLKVKDIACGFYELLLSEIKSYPQEKDSSNAL